MMSEATSSPPFIFQFLPVELLREVFEHAAHCDISTALSLSLVSSWSQHWIEPLLYHTVVLSTTRGLRAFLLSLSRKHESFPKTHVKHLGIFAQGPVQAIDQVLGVCQGLDSVACGFSLSSYKQFQEDHGAFQTLDFPKEQHFLGLSCRDGWDTTLVGPSVTHLRIHITSSPDKIFTLASLPDDTEGATTGGWERLSALSALTHLAVVYRPSSSCPVPVMFDHLQGLLIPPETPSLLKRKAPPLPDLALILVQVVGMLSSQRSAIEEINGAALDAGGKSLRIVAQRAPLSTVVQWEKAVREGRSVWQGAEEIAKARLTERKERQRLDGQ